MIYAYTHFNVGDDLFIKILCERYPNTRFILHAPREYKKTFKEINNMHLYPNDSIFIRGFNYVFRKLHMYNFSQHLIAKTCDLVVHIGGSLFIQNINWRDDLRNTKALKIKDKPFFLLGPNFGPFHDQAFYLEHRDIFKQYTDICFREKHSYNLFKDLSNVRLADDIVFQLKKQNVQQTEKSVVISVIKPSIRKSLESYDAVYYEKISDITVDLIEKGYNITLMSFCEFEGDQEAIESIMKLVPTKHSQMITKHFYKHNLEDTLNIIARSSFVIATRLHAMILGWVYNKPVFPIVYNDKMTYIMSDIGFKGLSSDFKRLHTLKSDQVLKSIEINAIDVSKQTVSAEKHFEKLDAYLAINEKG